MTQAFPIDGLDRLPVSLRSSLAPHLTPEKLHAVLSYPTWNYIRQAIDSTRSYEQGLDAALMLLYLAEEYGGLFSPKHHARQMMDLYWFILHILDKLDRWEDYLRLWNHIRQHTTYALTYTRSSREVHGSRIAPFIMREGTQSLYVHFLYPTSHRRSLIERKVARQRKGSRIGNLVHAKQSELTQEEIHRRLKWIIDCYKNQSHNDV